MPHGHHGHGHHGHGHHGHGHHPVENAIHRAEVREEKKAIRDLAHGNVAGFVQHQQNANALANMEQAVHASNHHHGHHHHGHHHHGHGNAARKVENALHHAEVREEQKAIRDLAHGNVAGYVQHQQNAQQIHNVEQAVHNAAHPHGHHHHPQPHPHHHHHHGHGIEKALHNAEVREERKAIRDLAHGNVAGYVQHQQNAQQIHNVEQAVHNAHHPHHHHHHHHHHHRPPPCENTPLVPNNNGGDNCCNCSIQ